MDLTKIIGELQQEREKLSQIIQSLEQLSKSSVKFTEPTEARRGRRFMDAEARMDVSRRMKKYWAARRAAGVKKHD
jgi:hypothetical protein